jgi:hypothetical protein
MSVFDNPHFKNMVEILSHSKEKVKLPGHKLARSEVIEIFQGHLRDLKGRFAVSGQIYS